MCRRPPGLRQTETAASGIINHPDSLSIQRPAQSQPLVYTPPSLIISFPPIHPPDTSSTPQSTPCHRGPSPRTPRADNWPTKNPTPPSLAKNNNVQVLARGQWPVPAECVSAQSLFCAAFQANSDALCCMSSQLLTPGLPLISPVHLHCLVITACAIDDAHHHPIDVSVPLNP